MNHGPKIMKIKVYHSTVLHFWENSLFFDTNEKWAKLVDPERVQTFAIKHRTKNMHGRCVFCVLWGKLKKLKKKSLLGHCWIAQSMDFIFPIVNGYSRKSRGFRTITREPQTQISCMLVLISLF